MHSANVDGHLWRYSESSIEPTVIVNILPERTPRPRFASAILGASNVDGAGLRVLNR